VTYWMPFYGNIGVHDASWRHSFGGEIYKRVGSHGCVNAPLYLAKIIFEQISEGTPFISYEE
jgi:lipoprotein-anchoring transpeptidase ErfK/SrfK